MAAIVGLLVAMVALLCVVSLVLIGRVAQLRRDLEAETKDRREQRWECKEFEWRMNEALAVLGLRRESAKPEKWVKE